MTTSLAAAILLVVATVVVVAYAEVIATVVRSRWLPSSDPTGPVLRTTMAREILWTLLPATLLVILGVVSARAAGILP